MIVAPKGLKEGFTFCAALNGTMHIMTVEEFQGDRRRTIAGEEITFQWVTLISKDLPVRCLACEAEGKRRGILIYK
jgi:hypothetical protein